MVDADGSPFFGHSRQSLACASEYTRSGQLTVAI